MGPAELRAPFCSQWGHRVGGEIYGTGRTSKREPSSVAKGSECCPGREKLLFPLLFDAFTSQLLGKWHKQYRVESVSHRVPSSLQGRR